jgi:Xaa-Pro aminopeptidase
MKQVTAATLRAWRDIQAALRPGLPFAEIPNSGRESLRPQGVDFSVSFTPHSVGLFHTDHPQRSAFEPEPLAPLVLEQDMILAVDCPPGDTGAGGSTHLEDLVWIRAEGAEPIHAVPPNVLVV